MLKVCNFTMENYCTKAKKEHFFPEFSNCTFNSSSVDNEQQRQDRGKSRVEDEEGRVEKRALKEKQYPIKGYNGWRMEGGGSTLYWVLSLLKLSS